MSEEGGRRAKRRCARNKYTSTALPSAIHYVGYVEDDETPEMIMAKFAELERIQQAAGQAKAAKAAAAAAAAASADDDGAAAGIGVGPADGQLQQQQQQGDGQTAGAVAAVPADGSEGQPAAGVAAAAAAAQQQQPASSGGPTANDGDGDGNGGGEGGGLTEEQLLEVFKQTSMFNVRTALQDNEMLLGIDEILEHTNERYADDEAISEDEDMLRTFWSDDDDLLLSEGEEEGGGGARRNRSRRGGGGRMSRTGSGVGSRLQRNAACVKARHNVITAFNPITQALVRRKVRAAGGGGEREEIYQLRVPPAPIPVSWGRTVQPYVPAHLRAQRQMAVPVPPALLKAMQDGSSKLDMAAMERCVYREERSIADVAAAGWNALLAGAGGDASGCGGYQAVLVNPGWECEGRGDAAVQRLAKLPMRRLVPKGFVFIFVEKQHVQALCRQMRAWGYCYIENLTWVYLRPNNHILRLPSRYANNSHITLYMFRREGEGKDIELRHQRNPDVTFDCLYKADGVRRAVPEETFVAIETLLPTGKGSFLELWAPQGVRRPGWTHVVEVGVAEC